jgi:hypothetical protein
MSFMSFYVISYHVIYTCHFISCFFIFMSFHIISCHFMSFHVMSFHVISCHIMSFQVSLDFSDHLLIKSGRQGQGQGEGREGQICLSKMSVAKTNFDNCSRSGSDLRIVVAKSGLDSPAYIFSLAWPIYLPFGYDMPLLIVHNP